ncbi:MAG: hypothetical protein ABI231_03515 [Candidatus Tumulicola sp.]
MTYVEWLRIRGVLKWTGIVLIAGVVLLLALRLSLLTFGSNDALLFVHGLETNKGSRVVHTTLSDGTKRTTIDNSKDHVHVVIDDLGYQGKRIQIFERSSHGMTHPHKTISMGDLHVETRASGKETVTTVETNRPESFGYYAAIASFVGLIVGTLLGAPFARENDGHLEVALTKPVRRETLGLATIGVDLAGIAAAWAMTVLFLIVAHTIIEAPHFTFGPSDATLIVLGLVGNAAWYAMLCAATASMKRSYGVILGVAWPAAIVVTVLAKLQLNGSQMGQVVHAVVTPISWIDPFSYLHFGPAYTVNGQPAGSMAVAPHLELPMLAILALVYGTLAVLQWRRVEA